jgi:cellulose synthase (UDP-forming)
MEFLLAIISSAFIFMLGSSFVKNKKIKTNLKVWLLLLIAIIYFYWRIQFTILPFDFGLFNNIWMWVVLKVEILGFLAGFLYLFLRTTTKDRSKEADDYERQLKEFGEYPTVDIFIPTYNEPQHVIKKTIFGAKNIDYPAYTVHVLDDGKRDWLRDFCAQVGVNYIARDTNEHAKAGNLNNALYQTSGDLIAIFDADFIAFPRFLNRTVGFFADPTIGIVQTPHHFYNSDPIEHNIRNNNIGDEQRLWFDDILPARDGMNVATSCGSSSVVSRRALDVIGGQFPVETITEDYDTSIRMLEKGLITRYLNERLSVGLAAEDTNGFYTQRKRWARGNIQVWKLHWARKHNKFNLLTYLMLFDWYYIIKIPSRIFMAVLPLFFLYFGLIPLAPESITQILFFHFVFIAASFYVLNGVSINKYIPFVTAAVNISCAMRIFPEVIATYISPFGKLFAVTPKGINGLVVQDKAQIISKRIFQGLALLLLIGSIWSLLTFDAAIASAVYIAVLWALSGSLTFFVASKMLNEKPRYRKEERFVSKEFGILRNSSTGENTIAKIKDISLSGISLEGAHLDTYDTIDTKELHNLKIKFKASVKNSKQTFTTWEFELTPEQEELLVNKIFSDMHLSKKRSSFRNIQNIYQIIKH